MADRKVSLFTSGVPALTDLFPFARPGNTDNFTATGEALLALANQGNHLTANTIVGATTLPVNGPPRGAIANGIWVVIDPYTIECEIRKVTGISGNDLTVAALTYAHADGDGVLFIPSPVYHLAWFGGGPGIAAATNSTAIQRAINAAAGSGWVIAGAGTYSYDTDLEIPDGGLYLAGVGASSDAANATTLSYTGTGTAIKLAAGFTNDHQKIKIQNLRLLGTVNASNGIDLTGQSKYGITLRDMHITGFSKSGAYALVLEDVYAGLVERVNIIENNDSCIKCAGVVNASILECWLHEPVKYGIHITSTGILKITGGIIDSTAQPSTQVGIYVTTDPKILIIGTHFESLYKHFDLEMFGNGAEFRSYGCFYGTHTVDWTIADGVKARFRDNFWDITNPQPMGLGSSWSGNWARTTPPTQTDLTTGTRLSNIMKMAATAPLTFLGWNGTAAREFDDQLVMLRFLDGNTTLQHNGAVNGPMFLRDGLNWNPKTDEAILLAKSYYETGDTDIDFIEVGRWQKPSSRFEHLTGDRTITTADHGMTFDNIDGGAVTIITLPAVSAATQGLTITVVKTHNSNAIHIDPNGNDRIKCVTLGGIGKKLQLAGSGAYISVTLQNVMGALGTFWECVAGSNEAACTFEA